jgi:ADP-ribose diphosphatase
LRPKPQILRRTTLASSRIFRIEQLALRFANGAEATYERIVGGGRGAVLIVPLRDPETLLLVREYAAGIERYELSFPKGRLEVDEDILAGANRELREEIGHGAADLTLLRTLNLAPGYVRSTTYLILARDLYPARLAGDEPEPIEIVPWPLSRSKELLTREEFSDARNVAALLLVKEWLRDN